MAENQQNAAQRFLSWLNPVPRFQEMGSRIANHPGQAAVELGARAVPFVGPILGRLVSNYNTGRNNRETNQQMVDQLNTRNEELSNQIFPPNGPGQQPTAGMSATSQGSMGPPGGMAGITSPWAGQQQQGTSSPLMQMLGIPNYAGNPGPSQPSPGYAGGHNEYTGQAGSNFVGPGQNENTGGYGGGQSSGPGKNFAGITTSDIENMLSAGMHDRSSRMTQRREMSGDRGAMQQAGFAKLPGETPQAYRARAQQAGII